MLMFNPPQTNQAQTSLTFNFSNPTHCKSTQPDWTQPKATGPNPRVDPTHVHGGPFRDLRF